MVRLKLFEFFLSTIYKSLKNLFKSEPVLKKILIVGLGNPGIEYENTRHNIGFKIIDNFALKKELEFDSFRYGMISKSKIKGKMIILLKPNTFMNLSGKAINYWIKKEKVLIENILIVTDDLNLPFGKLRLRSKGNDGGHNGLKDIQDKLNSTNYSRLRFGIKNKVKIENKVDYVIGKWTKNESELLEKIIIKTEKIISSFILSGVNITMNEFNNN